MQVIFGLIAFLALAIVIVVTIKNWNWFVGDYGLEETVIIPAVASAFLLFAGCFTVFDAWNWIAIFNPKVALFHQLIQKFLN